MGQVYEFLFGIKFTVFSRANSQDTYAQHYSILKTDSILTITEMCRCRKHLRQLFPYVFVRKKQCIIPSSKTFKLGEITHCDSSTFNLCRTVTELEETKRPPH